MQLPGDRESFTLFQAAITWETYSEEDGLLEDWLHDEVLVRGPERQATYQRGEWFFVVPRAHASYLEPGSYGTQAIRFEAGLEMRPIPNDDPDGQKAAWERSILADLNSVLDRFGLSLDPSQIQISEFPTEPGIDRVVAALRSDLYQTGIRSEDLNELLDALYDDDVYRINSSGLTGQLKSIYILNDNSFEKTRTCLNRYLAYVIDQPIP